MWQHTGINNSQSLDTFNAALRIHDRAHCRRAGRVIPGGRERHDSLVQGLVGAIDIDVVAWKLELSLDELFCSIRVHDPHARSHCGPQNRPIMLRGEKVGVDDGVCLRIEAFERHGAA